MGRQCVYCGIKDVPLQIEHIYPRAKGGANSITNLTLSCEKCKVIRSSGSFNISTKNGLVQGISHKFCKSIHAKDGYSYVQ